MEKEYYIPIKSVNLSNYYRTAIIAPANYIESRNDDIQTPFENNLLLSEKKFTKDTDCALGIIFDSDEEKPKKISANFHLFNMPLPISRVKKIYFASEDQKKTTLFNIRNGAAFLPDDLVQVDSESDDLGVEEINSNDIVLPSNEKNWSKHLKFYDKVLGGLALMITSREEPENYPLNYLHTLSFFNKKIEDELHAHGVSSTNDYSWAFKANSGHKELRDIVYSEVDSSTVTRLSHEEKVEIETRNGLFVLDSMSTKNKTYLSAILATYGKDKRKKIDEFIADFKSNKFEKDRLEGIALIFGINNGYSAFRNKYKLGNSTVTVKFEFDSKLDFYTVESVYQFIFNDKSNNGSFPYIDSWCPQFEKGESIPDNYFVVLDKYIYSQEFKRETVFDRILNILKKWFPLFNMEKLNEEIKKEVDEEIGRAKDVNQEKEGELYLQKIKDKDEEIDKLKNEVQELKSTLSESRKREGEIAVSDTKAKTKHGGKEVYGELSGEQESNPVPNEASKAREKYIEKSRKELNPIAKKLGIRYSKYNKDELIDKIIEKEFKQS